MEIDRRAFLKGASAVSLLALLPRRRVFDLVAASSRPGVPGHFLDAHQLTTFRAVTYRMVPGPLDEPGPLNTPPETDPGAREARCAEAIDILLNAFEFDPPMIHAGGPFSNRAGSAHDDFADFVPLDAHAALGWRIRLEGSRGLPEREFAGPVTGLQQIYVSGLTELDRRSHSQYGVDYADASGPQQDSLLLAAATNQADDLNTFVSTALSQTLDAMYGPPEYGGNHDLVGWRYTHFEGDVQPRGWTDAEVSEPGGSAVLSDVDGHAAVRFLAHLHGRPASRQLPWLSVPGLTRG